MRRLRHHQPAPELPDALRHRPISLLDVSDGTYGDAVSTAHSTAVRERDYTGARYTSADQMFPQLTMSHFLSCRAT